MVDKQRTVGWREWVSLPALGIPAIKAKIDTGARTSAIHAFRLDTFEDGGRTFARFSVHPIQHCVDIEIECTAPVIDIRKVRDSGGHEEERYVIETPVCFDGDCWPAEITLTNRETMLFKMLIGRTTMIKAGITVDPARSFMLGTGLEHAYELAVDGEGER